MNMGFIPAMLSCKVAVHECHTFARESGIPIYPWIGSGSLPFRGGVNPEHIAEVIEEYKGVYSVSIQTAFRSDYPLEQAKSAIATLHKELPKAWEAYTPLELKTVSRLRTLILESTPFFRESIEALAETINGVAKHVPKHRERMQHIGLFGYSRGVGSVTLPRAITFTASLYSLGIPPELIGSGRILAHAAQEGKLSLLEEFFPTLRAQLQRAGAFLNKENLSLLLAKDPAWNAIQEDVLAIEAYLGTPLAPRTTDELIHRNLTSTILHKYFSGEALTEDILAAARFRKSLG
jgi:phosphoenolpyruvate carboxylase